MSRLHSEQMTPAAAGPLPHLGSRPQPLPTVPIHSRMTKWMSLPITELNCQQHEYLAEAFDKTYNMPNLLYPLSALTTKRILMQPAVASSESTGSLSVPRGHGAWTWSVGAEWHSADGGERSARLRHRGQRTT